MAILHRFGSADEFDPSKMKARELAYVNTSNSTYKAGLYLCYAPGDVRRQTTEQDIINILNSSAAAYSALQQLINDLNNNPSELTNILANISALQTGKLDKTGNSKDNTVTFTEAATDTDIASGGSHATLFGRILKSIKTIRSGKLDKSSIANNLITTASGLALDARQGKALQDQITAQNDNLGNYKRILVTVVASAGGTAQFNVASGGVYLVLGDNGVQSAVYMVSEFSNVAYPSPIKSNANCMTVTANGAAVTITVVPAYTRVLVIRLG